MFKLLDVRYDNISFDTAMERFEELLKSHKKSNLFFLNAAVTAGSIVFMLYFN